MVSGVDMLTYIQAVVFKHICTSRPTDLFTHCICWYTSNTRPAKPLLTEDRTFVFVIFTTVEWTTHYYIAEYNQILKNLYDTYFVMVYFEIYSFFVHVYHKTTTVMKHIKQFLLSSSPSLGHPITLY